ncbi:1-aminocyclopropane-1-carboxylate deaminase [Arcobacter venerupis]|uniref:1-aminocyclopropane-1-carboxylate deaminase n=1 Tax=Arcobacter venerupis TaxID=1054033 RepID=A0AAE7B9B0_9BACT|nr:1-aminocyclopropane-1-carboxylate deaminase [Arcobacter venerupis]QKF66124.1 1-aminocyclopropane-1-carboxylate deaminase [Arcobacter venerupis]RWS51088.1 1-aminocyclopropane-1-carboxylate deaminase [Arcobacter venerupis]
MNYTNSPIQKITFNNQKYFVKRDDLLNPDFSGNKARKFYYYLINDFPNIKKIVSFGSAQSNAMYSLSVLCKLKGLKFDYYVDHIASYLKENPLGNYKYALENKMNIIENELPTYFDEETLFISEGGALKEASLGIEILANEIKTWAIENKIENLKIFLPSGTGTTALYLQKYLPFEVLTCACVGDEDYLKKQFLVLEKDNHPTIIQREKKYHFGKLYKEFYEIHKELKKQTNIEFDFLYDNLGWICFEKYRNSLNDKNNIFLYIHQGGLIGNISMLERYKFKYDK